MKKLFVMLFILISVNCFALSSTTQILNNTFYKSLYTTVLSEYQTVTGDWKLVGTYIDTRGVRELGVFIAKTINDSTDLRFKIAGALTASGPTYLINRETVSSGVGTIDDYYKELADDNSNNVLLKFTLDRLYPYTYLYVQAGTAGSTAATIDSVSVSKGR